MIIRISNEGQYEISEADRAQLTELDNQAVARCASDDEPGFRADFDRLLEFVRGTGRPVAADYLGGSDLILPPPDVSLAEARVEFKAEKLIPD